MGIRHNMKTIQIKTVGGEVLFEHACEDNSIMMTLGLAIEKDTNLCGANLCGANLHGANLGGANLEGANLGGANLEGANLEDATIKSDEKLVGLRPIFQVGPIGSRNDFLIAYITDKGLRFDAGCQRQITREVFESRLTELHGENEHAREYRAALALIDAHAEIWTPKEDAHVIGADPSGMDEGKK